MSWHYQIRRRKCMDGWAYDIVEVYTRPKGWTGLGIAPHGSTRGEVIRDLEMMLTDAKHYPTLTDKEA